jgi:hypothetical protein
MVVDLASIGGDPVEDGTAKVDAEAAAPMTMQLAPGAMAMGEGVARTQAAVPSVSNQPLVDDAIPSLLPNNGPAKATPEAKAD